MMPIEIGKKKGNNIRIIRKEIILMIYLFGYFVVMVIETSFLKINSKSFAKQIYWIYLN
jgi:hypothetical protein